MFKFRKEQKIVEVGGVKLGGQPGELPTVLTATIFYIGHKIVGDEKKGIFDKEKAEALIKKIEEASDQTTNPFILDIVGTTEEAFQKFIGFVSDVTEAPFQIDAISPKVRMATVKWVSEVGLASRTINNSIYKGVKDAELENLKNSGIKASIVLCDNPDDESANGRLEILKEILPMADKAGIEAALIDTAIPCWGIGVGAGSRAIYLVKEEFGDRGAVGTGIGNVTDTLGWVKGNFPKEVRRACDASQNAILPILGADWIMFGPIELAEYVFPAVAVIDTYVLTATAELGTRPLIEGMHPLFKTVG
ncbi:MAG: tetrahydromethanopterin S-methyltransferase subunit H [Candidatus Bathyarchaeota archaeon]|nr:tetrahydromethanopterin S-methyltransferase subunit H [Candidatus Bathyarchaeota archaeon]